MSAAYYIVLERAIPGLNHFVTGKALSKNAETLDSIAKQAGVPPLMDFFSAAPEELAGFAEDHGVGVNESCPGEKWFSAQDGLRTVKMLIDEGERKQIDARAISELREFQNVLEAAKQHGVGWHLAVDF